MSRREFIESKLKEVFSPLTILEVEDESHQHSGHRVETHFRVVLVSEALQGLSRVEREQKVQGLFMNEREKGLHALSVRLYTPSEWDRLQQKPEPSPVCQSRVKI